MKKQAPKKQDKLVDVQFGNYKEKHESNSNIEMPKNTKINKPKNIASNKNVTKKQQDVKVETKFIPKPVPKPVLITTTKAGVEGASWTSFFETTEPKNMVDETTEIVIKQEKPVKSKPIPKNGPNTSVGTEILSSSIFSFKLYDPVWIQPRGFVNAKNSCYLNATLQSLLYLPPFYNLIKTVSKLKLDPYMYPLCSILSRFVNEFSMVQKDSTRVDLSAKDFLPRDLLEYLNNNKILTIQHGKQQDAQEFLIWLLDSLSKEMTKTKTTIQEDTRDLTHDDGWEQVGPNQKTSKLQEIKHTNETSISQIFGGKSKSSIKKRNAKASITVEPFYTLQLPIDESMYTIYDAFKAAEKEEILENGMIKQVSLQEVPPILILHLKRFCFQNGESFKMDHKIDFPHELLSSKISKSNKKYQLCSMVCHHGNRATEGHYTTYALHPSGKWIHFDDTKMSIVSSSHVVQQEAYMLMYMAK